MVLFDANRRAPAHFPYSTRTVPVHFPTAGATSEASFRAGVMLSCCALHSMDAQLQLLAPQVHRHAFMLRTNLYTPKLMLLILAVMLLTISSMKQSQVLAAAAHRHAAKLLIPELPPAQRWCADSRQVQVRLSSLTCC